MFLGRTMRKISVFCILLSAMLVLLWVRSYSACHEIRVLYRVCEDGTPSPCVKLWTWRGELRLSEVWPAGYYSYAQVECVNRRVPFSTVTPGDIFPVRFEWQRHDVAGLGTFFEASVPIWCFAAALIVVPMLDLLRYRWRRGRGIGGCERCGYDLTGNVSGRCPECGCATKILGKEDRV
jgi:hypothetical protein